MNVEAMPGGALRIDHAGASIVIPQAYVASLMEALRQGGASAALLTHLESHRALSRRYVEPEPAEPEAAALATQ